MNQQIKVSKIACILSGIAFLISLITLFLNYLTESINSISIVIPLCMIAVFFSNYSIYKSSVKKDDKEQ